MDSKEKKHETIVNMLYSGLCLSRKFQHIARHQEYPLELQYKTLGEVDVIAMNLKDHYLNLYEVKSSAGYLGKGRQQLKRAKKYYKQFGFKKINKYLVYVDRGLEKIIEVK